MGKLGQVSHEASLASLGTTERKREGLWIERVEVELMGELAGFPPELLCAKSIELNHFSYDMVEGETVMQLGKSLPYAGSANNQLYTLRYYFKVKAFFVSAD